MGSEGEDSPRDFIGFLFSPHANESITARNITQDEVSRALFYPDRRYPGKHGRMIAERRLEDGSLVRVIYTVEPTDEAWARTYPGNRPRSSYRRRVSYGEAEEGYSAVVITVIHKKSRKKGGPG